MIDAFTRVSGAIGRLGCAPYIIVDSDRGLCSGVRPRALCAVYLSISISIYIRSIYIDLYIDLLMLRATVALGCAPARFALSGDSFDPVLVSMCVRDREGGREGARARLIA